MCAVSSLDNSKNEGLVAYQKWEMDEGQITQYNDEEELAG